MKKSLFTKKAVSISLISSLLIFFQNCAQYGVGSSEELAALDANHVSENLTSSQGNQTTGDSNSSSGGGSRNLATQGFVVPVDQMPGVPVVDNSIPNNPPVTVPESPTTPEVVAPPPVTEPPVVVNPPSVVEPPVVVTPPPVVETVDPSLPFACLFFQEIKDFPFEIPARTKNGVCYYKKLFDLISFSNSGGAHSLRLDSVWSRGHGADAGHGMIHPYILGRAVFDFKLLGYRDVKLSGKPNELASIRVDNFVLVGSRKHQDEVYSYSAYGTDDAKITYTNYVLADDQQVILKPFAAWGTATISALELTERFSVNEAYELSVNALDCGGMKELSDIYIVFQ